MRRIVCLLLLLIGSRSWSQAPAGYYDAAAGLSGARLRQALHAIIRNHHVIPYASSSLFDTSDALRSLDRDPVIATNVVGIYSRKSEPQSSFGLTSGWNREHLWADSYGLDGVEPAYSDLNNLRAEDYNVNELRANKIFDQSNPSGPGYQKPASTEAPLASFDANSWQPPDVVKGDIARSLFYMAVRYTGDVAGEPRLVLTDRMNLISGTAAYMGRLSTLLKWANADPVDTPERARNEAVYGYQANRNPFIDHPEWVNAAFAPELSLAVVTTNLWLEWNADYTLLQLERCGTAGGPWLGVSNAAVLTNGVNRVSLPVPTAATMFRLRLQ